MFMLVEYCDVTRKKGTVNPSLLHSWPKKKVATAAFMGK